MPYDGFDVTDWQMGLHEQPCPGDCSDCGDCDHPDCRHKRVRGCRVPRCDCRSFTPPAAWYDFPDHDWMTEPF